MSDLLDEQQGHVYFITFNRVTKRNAFDEHLLQKLTQLIEQASNDTTVRVIVLKANGSDFSAGADLNWMQRMADMSETENLADAKILANLMSNLYHCRKPTIAMIQGAAFGGGAGLAAACDIAIASDNARFCFSEVKLGLIPAVISPYVIKAIGSRAASALFMSAEIFEAKRAYELHLVHHLVKEENLLTFTENYANQIAGHAPQAVIDSKALIREVMHKPIDATMVDLTAGLIAKKRVSAEGKRGLKAFLNKEKPNWD